MLNTGTLDNLFAQPLRGKVAMWPRQWQTGASYETAKRRLLFHGISGVLNERRDLLLDWPDDLLNSMREESLARTMWELRHSNLLKLVFSALHGANIRSALLKGTALAYTYYANPAHRFRGDSDLLILETELPATRAILTQLGWVKAGYEDMSFGHMHFQEIWQFKDPAGFVHDIDLHWEVTNSSALRYVLDVHQVLADAVPLIGLGPYSSCADPVTALIHGCINRETHAHCGYFIIDRNEFDPNRLVWAHDFHLQAERMTDEQWDIFLRRNLDTGVASICADALGFAFNFHGTQIPERIMKRLSAAPRETKATKFIRANGAVLKVWMDLRATPGTLHKLRFVLARIFPSPGHMRDKYPDLQRWPTAALYARRLFEAALNSGNRRGG